MRVFISWSGDRSKAVAEALHDWLPSVIQAVQPWMSANDIEKGTRWRSGLANELEQASVSIICLTPENMESPWINFEAGALSKQQQSTYICTFLLGLEPIDLREPLAQFQATKAEKGDIRKLAHSINRLLGDTALPEGKINEAFDVWWPKLEQRLNSVPTSPKPEQQSNRDLPQELEHQRDVREILAEILELVRAQSISSQSPLLRAGHKLPAARLLSTFDWSPEDAQTLSEHYELVKERGGARFKNHLRRLRTDRRYAREWLDEIKIWGIDIYPDVEITDEHKEISPSVDTKDQQDDNSNS